MDKEQEREVLQEREHEREVELPPKAEPSDHFLHSDVASFIQTGVIPPLHSRSAFLPVFTTLQNSSAATREADVWSPFILATADFCRMIKPDDQVLVLPSPFEADRLMPDIRASKHVHLHMYESCAFRRMKPSDDLKLYSIPPLLRNWTPPWALIDQMNVFIGQLYLRDYRSYLRLCRFLEVPMKESPNDTVIQRNLFDIPRSFKHVEITFSGSPLSSVMELLALQTRGQPFSYTHLGKILQGQCLTEQDFEGQILLRSYHTQSQHGAPGTSRLPQSYHPILTIEDHRCLNQF
ncbi:hypothetical protein V8E55_008110 [Tylopilus felleus]